MPDGYTRSFDSENGCPIDLAQNGVLHSYECLLDAGSVSISWAQDTMRAYNGLVRLGYMAAVGHDAGSKGISIATSKNRCRDFTRFETNIRFGTVSDVEAWAACTIPPNSNYPGAYDYVIANVGGFCNAYRRPLAEYDQAGNTGGIVQAEGGFSLINFGGFSLGQAIRDSVDSAYGVSTVGIPTMCHSLSPYGATNASTGGAFFGFHGLTGAPPGPYVGHINGEPRDGSANLGFVARIGGLAEGVEPTVTWSHVGGGSRLCGFVRSQSISYGVRFWEAESAGHASVEAADTYTSPFGDNFARWSPVPCRMRPRRKGSVSGWIATSETLDGTDSDELHYVFTGKRTGDGKPCHVPLYWGRVTRLDGKFGNIWTRSVPVLIGWLYFAKANAVNNSNQVGVPSMCFSDANTLHIAASTETPAIKADYDGNAYMRVITLVFHDNYADESERLNYDDGRCRPFTVQRTPEYAAY